MPKKVDVSDMAIEQILSTLDFLEENRGSKSADKFNAKISNVIDELGEFLN